MIELAPREEQKYALPPPERGHRFRFCFIMRHGYGALLFAVLIGLPMSVFRKKIGCSRGVACGIISVFFFFNLSRLRVESVVSWTLESKV